MKHLTDNQLLKGGQYEFLRAKHKREIKKMCEICKKTGLYKQGRKATIKEIREGLNKEEIITICREIAEHKYTWGTGFRKINKILKRHIK